MKISEQFPSNYLKATDLQGRTAIVTINVVQSEEIGSGEHKPVIYFEGRDKGLVLNKTNAATIAMAYGDDTEDWGGNDVELFSMAVPYNGQMVPAIRVRVPAAKAAPKRTAGNNIAPNARARAQAIQEKHYDERNPPPADPEDQVPF